MIKDGKYRFTLQFGMRTAEEQKAGSLLEQLGKKKSPVVVAALNEYMERHPEILSGNARIQFHVSGPEPDQLEQMIRRLIDERLGAATPPLAEKQEELQKLPLPDSQISSDILEMLSDLDMFN